MMKKSVMVVDDSQELRILLKVFLSKKYIIEIAANGLEAIDILEDGFRPDIIVSDIMMPSLDGLSMIEHLRYSGRYSHVPIIILSSIDRRALREDIANTGANDYLMKPFNPEELEAKIDNLTGIATFV